jgi:hypothetical protein
VREALEDGFIEADGAEKFNDAGASPIFCVSVSPWVSVWVPVDDERLGDDLLDAEAGIERGEWILEDDLHIAAQSAHFAAVGGEQVVSFEADAAGSRFDEAQDQTSECALARPRFADQAEGFTRVNVKRNIVDGTDFVSVARLSAKRSLALRINLRQLSDFDKRHGLYSGF